MVNDKEITPDAYAGLLESIKREISGSQARAALIKDRYTLDFADNGLHERALHAKIAENITRFLQELGTRFAFVGSKVQVEYTLRNNAAPIAVSTHTALPQDVRAALPSAEEPAGAIAPALREDSSQDDEEEPL